jgi:hypothetical protein
VRLEIKLLLGNGCQEMDGELIGMGVIASNEVNARFHQTCQEMKVSAKPVKLRNNRGELRAHVRAGAGPSACLTRPR